VCPCDSLLTARTFLALQKYEETLLSSVPPTWAGPLMITVVRAARVVLGPLLLAGRHVCRHVPKLWASVPSAGELHRLQPRVDGAGKTADQVIASPGSCDKWQIAASGPGLLSSLFLSADHRTVPPRPSSD